MVIEIRLHEQRDWLNLKALLAERVGGLPSSFLKSSAEYPVDDKLQDDQGRCPPAQIQKNRSRLIVELNDLFGHQPNR